MSAKSLVILWSILLLLWVTSCETVVTCASCIDPDLTVFAFDTTANGFTAAEIDTFYIIRFARGELNQPLDTSDLQIDMNPFFITRDLFGTSTRLNDYRVEGNNQEFSVDITDIDYTIIPTRNNCNCDLVINKSVRINGTLVELSDPFQAVTIIR